MQGSNFFFCVLSTLYSWLVVTFMTCLKVILVSLKSFMSCSKSLSNMSFFMRLLHNERTCSVAGRHVLLLQESYIHFNSVLVHLPNWIFWSKIL